MMFVSYTLCGALLLLTIFAGQMHQEILFVCAAILAIFFWASLFSLFPITVGHYFGETAAGSNYGVLYAIAKGSGGLYGGILSTLLISQHRFSVAIGAAAGMAILAGLIVIPLKFNPPIWREASSQTAGRSAVGSLGVQTTSRPQKKSSSTQ